MNVKPTFQAFHNDFVFFTKALTIMQNKNATKLFSIIKEYDLDQKP